MKKFANVRFPVLVACAVAIGIAAGLAFARFEYDVIWLAAVIPVTAAVFIICALRGKHLEAFLYVVIPVLFFVLSAAISCFRAYSYYDFQIEDGAVCAVTGRVADKGVTDYGEYIIIDNLTVNGVKADGKARVYLGESYGDYCETGYTVSFTTALRRYSLFQNGSPSYSATQGLKYYCTVSGGLESAYGFSLFGEVRTHIKNTVYGNLSSDSAAVVCAMLLGDTDGVDSGSLQAFRYGGVAHIFAVSGLHIGIIFGALHFILKKLRINRYVSAALCTGTVVFYAGVCGFSLSAVRAVIMCASYMLAGLTHNKRDGLNSLAVAVTVILLINPFSLYTAGFRLSVCAVGGIVILSRIIARFMKKFGCPDKPAVAAGVSLGAQAGTLPVTASAFGYLSGAGLLLNMFLIPIISVFYGLLFFCVMVSALLPPFAPYLVPVGALPIEGITSFLVGAGFENSLVTGYPSVWLIICHFALLDVISDKLNLCAPYRAAAVCCIASAAVCLSLI